MEEGLGKQTCMGNFYKDILKNKIILKSIHYIPQSRNKKKELRHVLLFSTEQLFL